jgi:hypothetical protein
LLRPPVDLAHIVVAGPAEFGEPDCPPIDQMQPRQRVVHAEIDRPPHLARKPRQRGGPEDAALEALHQIERRPDHLAVVAEQDWARHRHVGFGERRQHAELAVNGVGGR